MDELIERLSDLEHEQWAHWTRYMLTALRPLYDPSYDATPEEIQLAQWRLAGWWRQVATPYSELSEDEKEKDREWAWKVAATIHPRARRQLFPLLPSQRTVEEALDRYFGLE